jgi:membrane protein YqaA with SNARE-associated domain
MKHLLEILKAWGPLGVLGLSFIESLGIPNPGGTDFLLLFVAAVRPKDAMLSALYAVIGSMVGSAFFYEVTRRGGDALLYKYTSSGSGHKFRAWFQRYGLITVFIPALLPIPILPYKIFALCAGAMAVPRVRFMAVLGLARVIRYFALAYLGASLGEGAGPWLRAHLWHLLALAVLLTVSLIWMVRRANRETGTPVVLTADPVVRPYK